jgi:hypothetical protein
VAVTQGCDSHIRSKKLKRSELYIKTCRYTFCLPKIPSFVYTYQCKLSRNFQSCFGFSLEYAIRKVQENQVGLEMSGTHQLLIYAGNINLLGDDIKIP